MKYIIIGLLLSIGWHVGTALIEVCHIFDKCMIRKIKSSKTYKHIVSDAKGKEISKDNYERYHDTRMGFKP